MRDLLVPTLIGAAAGWAMGEFIKQEWLLTVVMAMVAAGSFASGMLWEMIRRER